MSLLREMNDFLKNPIIERDMEEIYARNYDWEAFHDSTVLVTGAYGMLASYIVYFLVFLRECKGVMVEIYAQGRSEGKAERRFGEYINRDYFHYINKDILSENGSDIPKTDYIIHAAGIANPRFYATNPVEVMEPNIIGTHRLLRSSLNREVRGFLLFSTGDVYGKVIDAFEISEETMGLMDPLDEHSCYGESKRAAETLSLAFFQEYKIRTVMARIGHTYGPTMDVDNDPRVFASFMKCALSDEDIVLYSDGLAKRPFCYITDATAGFFLLLLKGEGGNAYNVTNTDQMISIRDVASVVANIPEKPVNVVYKVREQGDTYRVNKYNMENRPVEKKLQDLGWTHPVGIKEGFTRVYEYFQKLREDNANGY